MIFDPEFVLKDAGSTRENLVGSRGRDDHQVYLVSTDASSLDRLQAGLHGEIAGHFVVCRKMPFDDTTARDDPVVRGINDLFQVKIGQHLGRQITSCADDF